MTYTPLRPFIPPVRPVGGWCGIRDGRTGAWVEGVALPGHPHRLRGTRAEMENSLRMMRSHTPGTCRGWGVEAMTDEEARK